MLEELQVVRVAKLNLRTQDFDGTEQVCRPPGVGDVGTVVHSHNPGDRNGPFSVEAVDDQGQTLWLADFAADEVEAIEGEAPYLPR